MLRFSRFTSSLVVAALLASLLSLPLAAQAPAAHRQLVQPPAAGVSFIEPLRGLVGFFVGRLLGLSGAATVPPVPVVVAPGTGTDGTQTPLPPATGGEGRGTMDPNG